MSLLKRLKDKNIYMVSDSDLDGVSGTTVFEYYVRPIAENIIFYNTGDRTFPDFNWDFVESADIVVFCDIAPPDIEFVERIQSTCELFIFDHHISSRINLGDFEGYTFDDTMCGAKILLQALCPGRKKRSMTQFVELVNTYDTWQTENPLFKDARNLHNVLYGYVNWARANTQTDYEKYLRFITMQLLKLHKYKNFFLTETEKGIAANAVQKEKKNYAQAKKTLSFRTDNSNNTYAYFSCASKLSWVCHLLLLENPQLDYIVSHSTYKKNTKLSLRSKGFDTTTITTKWGGGGHTQASGVELKEQKDFDAFVANKKHLV